jgi:MFS transporter, ACS family, D-galactonate transporter
VPWAAQLDVNRARTIQIILILLLQSFQTVSGAGIALLLPSIRKEFALSFTQGGTLAAANIFSYALLQLPAGYLADRFGLKRIFVIGGFGTTFLLLTFGLITSYRYAILNQTLAGVFHAFLFQSGLALLANLFGPERRATAMGLSLVGIFSGQLLINGLGPAIAQHFTWRVPFIAFGATGVLSALTYSRLGYNLTNGAPRQPLRIAEAVRLFAHPFMWVCGLLQYIRLGIIQGISFWLPSLLIDEKGFALGAAGLILALRSMLIAPSTMTGGYLSDKFRQPTAIMAVSLTVLAITTGALVALPAGALLIALIMVNAVFVQFYFGPTFALPIERYGTRMMGTLSGFGNLFANLGSFSFTYLLGTLKDRTGHFDSGFYTLTGTCVIGLGLTLMLERLRQRPRNEIKALG